LCNTSLCGGFVEHSSPVSLRSERLIPVLTPWEAPWWVLTSFITQRGSLVGINLPYSLPRRHPGGLFSLFYTLGGSPGGYSSVLHPRRLPWWVYTPIYTLGGTLVGICLSHTTLEAPWWVYASLLYPPGYTLVGISSRVHPRTCHAHDPPVVYRHGSGCRMCRFGRGVKGGWDTSDKPPKSD